MSDRSETPAQMPHYDACDFAALAIAFVVAYLRWGLQLQCCVGATFLWLMWLASRSDIEQRKIADALNAQIALVGVIALLLCVAGIAFPHNSVSWLSHLAGALLVPLPLIVAVATGASFGGGDIKLLAASGLVLGAIPGFVGLFLGLVAQGIYAIVLRARGASKSTTFAAAPFLAGGMAVAVLFAQEVVALLA